MGETGGTAEDLLTAQFRARDFCLDRLSELWYKQLTFKAGSAKPARELSVVAATLLGTFENLLAREGEEVFLCAEAV